MTYEHGVGTRTSLAKPSAQQLWLPDDNWLRNVELKGSLDYVATGLPKAGDVIGDERFLEDASPWSFSVVVVLPLAPLSP